MVPLHQSYSCIVFVMDYEYTSLIILINIYYLKHNLREIYHYLYTLLFFKNVLNEINLSNYDIL